ncbi:hypothetical protein ACRAKI_35235 [Saccharothrix isguenensis]
MVHRKAFVAPVAVSGGLLLLLLTGACGKPSANPEPVVIPTTSSSASATPTSIPAVADISVRPTTTTTALPPTVDATTEPPPPPPPPPVQVQPPPEPPAEPPTTTRPRYDEVALQGFPCDEQGAKAVDPAGRELVCKQTRRGRLVWDRD